MAAPAAGGDKNRWASDCFKKGTEAVNKKNWDLAVDRLWNIAPGPTGSECLRESPTFVAEVGPCTGGPTRTFSWHPHP